MTEPFILEGDLNLVRQEGGYAGPDWELDGSKLSDKVAAHFGAERVTWSTPNWRSLPHHAVPGDIPVGKVRITIERLE